MRGSQAATAKEPKAVAWLCKGSWALGSFVGWLWFGKSELGAGAQTSG